LESAVETTSTIIADYSWCVGACDIGDERMTVRDWKRVACNITTGMAHGSYVLYRETLM